jgi:hypothetical protein
LHNIDRLQQGRLGLALRAGKSKTSLSPEASENDKPRQDCPSSGAADNTTWKLMDQRLACHGWPVMADLSG